MKPMGVIFLIIFVNMLGFGMLIPIGPTILSLYHLTAFQYGILGAVFPLFQTIAAPILGRLSDIYGRRVIILISFIFVALSYIIFAYSHSYTTILISRILAGFFSGCFSVAMVCAADISTIENRTKYMGLAGMAFGFGFMLGPSVGALFAGHSTPADNILRIGLFGLILSLASLLIAILYLPETNKQPFRSMTKVYHEIFGIFKNVETVINLSFSGVLSFGLAGLEVFLSLWLSKSFGYSVADIGIFWTLYAVVMNLGRVIMVKFINHSLGITIIFFIMGCVFLIYAFTESLWVIYASSYLIGILVGGLFTVLYSRISIKSDPQQMGLFIGINNASSNLGRMLGPFCLGWIINEFNMSVGWIFTACVLFLSATFGFILMMKERKFKNSTHVL